MKPVFTHVPGPPVSPGPPPALEALIDNVQHPLIVTVGITTTTDGRWALFVTAPGDTEVPLAQVEAQAAGFPVIYEAEPDAQDDGHLDESDS